MLLERIVAILFMIGGFIIIGGIQIPGGIDAETYDRVIGYVALSIGLLGNWLVNVHNSLMDRMNEIDVRQQR